MKQFIEFIGKHQLGKIIENISFKDITSLKIGGHARVYFSPNSLNSLKLAYKYIKEHQIPFFIIGNGTNLLVDDKDFEMVLISLNQLSQIYQVNEEEFIVESGIAAPKLALYLAKKGYSGCEFISVIPGTIGGLIWMNAGAYRKETVEILKEIYYLDDSGEEKTLDVAQNISKFSYRHSPFQGTENIITGALIKVIKDLDPYAPVNKIKQYYAAKKNTQPINIGNAGSTFKNDATRLSWEIIDSLGFRGKRIGNAQVSQKHANFLVNVGDATFSDMIKLIQEIQKSAYEHYQINLKCEWEIIQ